MIDYLELSLYAAAEHIDDVETIATSFFRTNDEASRSREMRALKRSIKPLRDRISSLANIMKHDHGRLRMYAMEFRHDGRGICLFGFFVEGFKDGAVGPHPIHYGKGEAIISITAFLWSILAYLGRISTEIESFLVAIKAVDAQRPPAVGQHPLRRAVVCCARLPLYSFDDVHPFTTVRFVMHGGPSATADLSSGIYGSISNRWAKSDQHQFGGTSQMYAGDGVTRSFKIADPKRVQISHWD